MQEYLLQRLVEIASEPSIDEVISRARHRVALTRTRLDLADILEARDADRR